MEQLKNANSEEMVDCFNWGSEKKRNLEAIEVARNFRTVLGVIKNSNNLFVICTGILKIEKLKDNKDIIKILQLKKPITKEVAISAKRKLNMITS